nr:MAG TPA: hypothetical protein [Caudoviricetes sp.]
MICSGSKTKSTESLIEISGFFVSEIRTVPLITAT